LKMSVVAWTGVMVAPMIHWQNREADKVHGIKVNLDQARRGRGKHPNDLGMVRSFMVRLGPRLMLACGGRGWGHGLDSKIHFQS
jgi:hypothetical protein